MAEVEQGNDQVAITADAGDGGRRRRRLKIAAGVLWSLALVAGSVALAWEVFNRTVDPPAAKVTIEVGARPEVPEDEVATEALMPDVAGLTEAEARQAIGDSGIDTAAVKVAVAAHAGEAGRVFAQEPASGAKNPKKVWLTVSRPTTVPKLVGATAVTAVDQLEDLGVSVRQIPQFKSGTAAGTVLAVEPATGQPLPEEVVVRVASEPGQLFVDALSGDRSGCQPAAAKITGLASDHAIVCNSYPGSDYTMTYTLVAGVERFEATAGQVLGSDPGRTIQVDVLADLQPCATERLEGAGTKPLRCDLSGKATVTLMVTVIGEDDEADDVDVAFANARISGDPDALDQLLGDR